MLRIFLVEKMAFKQRLLGSGLIKINQGKVCQVYKYQKHKLRKNVAIVHSQYDSLISSLENLLNNMDSYKYTKRIK